MLRHVLFLCAAAAASLSLTRSNQACLHPPREYKGDPIEESGQQAIVLFDKGRQELILKVDYKLPDTGRAVTDLAWVVPTPSVPDHYAVESAKAFDELFRLTKEPERDLSDARNGSKAPNHRIPLQNIELLTPVAVGDYTIQPIKAKGKAAGAELNGWLTKNGFGGIPAANLDYYLERDWTFLAIRIRPGGETKSLESAGGLKPLRISFASDRIVYPLKFSAGQGVFDVTLYVITPDGLDAAKLRDDVGRYGFYFAGRTAEVNSAEAGFAAVNPGLAEMWKTIRGEGRMTFAKGVVNKLSARNINNPTAPLADWERDFSFAPAAHR